MSDRRSALAVLLVFILTAPAWAQAPGSHPDRTADPVTARMTVIVGKDVSGAIYKKLGLPTRQYCWDNCLKEERCSGVRWGTVDRDTAGVCVLISGPLSFKDLAELKTEDGKPIHVVAARKEPT